MLNKTSTFHFLDVLLVKVKDQSTLGCLADTVHVKLKAFSFPQSVPKTLQRDILFFPKIASSDSQHVSSTPMIKESQTAQTRALCSLPDIFV